MLLSFNLPLPGVDLASWQWIFFLNVPAGIITLLLIYVVAGGVETPRSPGRIDLVGALLISVALLSRGSARCPWPASAAGPIR